MRKQRIADSVKRIAGKKQRGPLSAGFTLIETMVAVSILMLAIIAPMTLTVQALNGAYYARDQVTASHLAQEGIEAVRAIRDSNVLKLAYGDTSVDLLDAIPTDPKGFRIDVRAAVDDDEAILYCSNDPDQRCVPLQTDGFLFGYDDITPMTSPENTIFRRTLTACYVQDGGGCAQSPRSNEVKLTSTVTWQTGRLPERSISISENLYRWMDDGSAI